MPIFYDNETRPNNTTDAQWAAQSNRAALVYLQEHSDVRESAVAKTLARGFTPDNPEYATVLANYGKEHWARYGREEERRGVGADVFRRNPGFYDVRQGNAARASANLVYQGSTAGDFIATVPRIDSNRNPPTVVLNPVAGEGATDPTPTDPIDPTPTDPIDPTPTDPIDPGATGGAGAGDTGIMSPAAPDPTRVFNTFQDIVNTPDQSLTDSQRYIRDFYSSTPEQRAALNIQNPNNQLPVAGYEAGILPRPNIGDAALLPDAGGTGGDTTAGTGGTGGTGGTDTEDGAEEGPDLASVIADLPNQITSGIETALANALPEQAPSLMSPSVVGTATPAPDLSPVTEDIGDVQADTTAIRGDIGTRAEGQPAPLMGQTAGLAQGQTDITGRIGTAPTPDATLFGGQAGLAQDLTTAQQGITGVQAGIGEAPVDPTTGDPTTLFQGQAGLMSGQTGLSTAISGVGNQATAIGGDLTALTNQLRNFENLSNSDRANILSTLNTRATELKDLANTYGLQTNRIAEQLTGIPAPTGIMAQAAPVAGSLPAVLAAERAQNTVTQNINRGLMDVAEQGQVGALGPVTPDPRVS